MINAAFDNNMSSVKAADIDSADKYAVLGYVTDKIAELVEKVVINEENQTYLLKSKPKSQGCRLL